MLNPFTNKNQSKRKVVDHFFKRSNIYNDPNVFILFQFNIFHGFIDFNSEFHGNTHRESTTRILSQA